MRRLRQQMTIVALLLGAVFLGEGLGIGIAREGSSEQPLVEARAAFQKGEFARTLELVEPLVKASPLNSEARRLKWLSLVRLKKTKEGLDELDRYSKDLGREEDLLLRELAIQSILPFRGDMREQIRGAAYTALKEIHSEDVVPYLEEGLSDKTGLVRALVAEGLGKLKAGRRSTRFQEALKDQAGLVRVAVLKGLGRSGNTKHITLIKDSLQDEQEVVQVAAAGALFMLGQSQYWGRIVNGTRVNEGYERGAALRILGELGDPRALPILKNGLADRQPSIRAASAASIGKLGLPQAISALIPLLSSDPIPAVRSVAVVSLGKLKAEKAVVPLTKALNGGSPGVRAAAVEALLRLNSPYSVVAGTVQEFIGHKNPGLRSGVARALSQGRIQDVVGPLTLLLKDPVPKPRISAVRSLGRLGGHEVMPLLKQALRDKDEAVQATAAGAIARILSHSS